MYASTLCDIGIFWVTSIINILRTDTGSVSSICIATCAAVTQTVHHVSRVTPVRPAAAGGMPGAVRSGLSCHGWCTACLKARPIRHTMTAPRHIVSHFGAQPEYQSVKIKS
jgi:hypothetical protein